MADMNTQNGKPIQVYLQKKGMSQGDFAQLFGVTQGRVSQWIVEGVTPERAKQIHDATNGAVAKWVLRPDIFDKPQKARAA